MATIDQEGLMEVEKIKNALNRAYEKLESNGSNSVVNDEYSFIFKILGQMEAEWNHDVNQVFTVPEELNINGKSYSSKS
jgi:hypothetical protein